MNVPVACLTSWVKNEFWIAGTDQNVISVNCHCCSLLHIAVSCCNQELLKGFKNSPDFWIIDFICMILWLWNNHHFLFYFVFKNFETWHWLVVRSSLCPSLKLFKVVCLMHCGGSHFGWLFPSVLLKRKYTTNKMFPSVYR